MPKATLTFDLPAEQAELEAAIVGRDAVDALDRYDQWLVGFGDGPIGAAAALSILRALRRGELVPGLERLGGNPRAPRHDDGSPADDDG